MPICRDVAVHIGAMLDLAPAVNQALGQCDEHWDGKGAVLGLKGEEISLPARLFLIAQDVEVFDRAGGLDAAVAVVRDRSGKYYDRASRACSAAWHRSSCRACTRRRPGRPSSPPSPRPAGN